MTELQRQRALMQEHLAWLDREIAAQNLISRVSTPPIATPLAPVPPVSLEPATEADAIIAQFGSDTKSLQTDVRRGCFLYFYLAFAVVGLGVLALYLYSTRR